MSSVVLNWKSPFELLFHTTPPIDQIRMFGCLCYVAVLGPSKTTGKFAPKGVQCLFIGYPPNNKGYKLLNLHTNHVFTSRDVEFHVSHFPFHNSSSAQPYNPTFPSFSTPSTSDTNIAMAPTYTDQPDPGPSQQHPSPTGNLSTLPVNTRKSTKARTVPTWLQDFVVPSNHTALFAQSLYLSHVPLLHCSATHISFLA